MVNRICKICGKQYEVCPTCETVTSFTPWRTLVCSAEEYMVFSALSDYTCNRDAKKASDVLNNMNLSKKTIRGYLPHVQKSIFDIHSAAKQLISSEQSIVEDD